MTTYDGQLHWVRINRSRSSRTQQAGDMIGDLVDGLEDSWLGDRQAIGEVISSVTDDLFTEHCRLGWIKQGVVTVVVDEPSLVFMMQRRWKLPLENRLKRALKRGRSHRVMFDYDANG